MSPEGRSDKNIQNHTKPGKARAFGKDNLIFKLNTALNFPRAASGGLAVRVETAVHRNTDCKNECHK